LVLILRALRARGGCGKVIITELPRATNGLFSAAMNHRCPECERLRAERDELAELVREQIAALLDLRHEMDARREKHAELLRQFSEIRELCIRKFRMSAAVGQEIAERLGLTTPPTRN
jgi:hypothetical protein